MRSDLLIRVVRTARVVVDEYRSRIVVVVRASDGGSISNSIARIWVHVIRVISIVIARLSSSFGLASSRHCEE